MRRTFTDLRYALRVLRRSPGFTAAVLLTLALGIGANAAVFSLVNGILLNPLPFSDADALFLLWEEQPDGDRFWFSAPNYVDVRAQSRAFEDVAAYSPDSGIVTGGDEPARIGGAEVTTNFFTVLGVEPILGRGFTADDDGTAVMVISHALWLAQFGGGADAIGQQLTLDGRSFEIIGVTPPGRLLPLSADVWIPISFALPEWRTRRGTGWIIPVGRLAPGMTLDDARADLGVITAALAREYPQANEDSIFAAQSLYDNLVGVAREPLLAMMGAVVLVLLIVCTNVAGLQLAWAHGRRHEVAIRMALGGGQRQIARQFLVESFVLASAGGLLGVGVGYWLLGVLLSLAPADTPRIDNAAMDSGTLAFCAAATLFCGLAFGLAPAVRAARLEGRGPGAELAKAGAAGYRMRGGLVAAQVALAVVLAVGSSLLLKSFWTLSRVDPGFDSSRLLTVGLPLIERDFPDPALRAQYYAEVEQQAAALPGLESVALVDALPIRDFGRTFSFELRRPEEPDEELLAGFRVVSAGYFETIGISIVEGRAFLPSDERDSAPVAIVDETFARRHFPDRSAVGQQILLLRDWRRIVGVAAAVRDRSLVAGPASRMFVPMKQALSTRQRMVLVARVADDGQASRDPMELLPAIQTTIRRIDPQQAFTLPMTMEQWISRSLASRWFTMTLLVAFGAASLVLTALGLYGLLAYSVGQRTREIGIRMAIGAHGHDIRKMVIGHGVVLTAVGVGIGIIAALAASRLLESLLYEVGVRDPVIFVGVPLALGVVALLASYLPASRACRVDPMVALRLD